MGKDVELDATEWTHFLKGLKGNMRNVSRYLKVAAATEGFADVIRHFDAESGPSGAWAALKRPRSGKILQLTGRLRGSVVPGSTVVELDNTTVKMFAGTVYSRTHDLGDPSRNIPQREFMWLSDKSQQKIAEMTRDLVMEASD